MEWEHEMKKHWLWIATLLIVAVIVGGVAQYVAERKDCLCYVAEHSPGSSFPLNDRVRQAVSGQELTDETMKICTYRCKHGKTMLLQIFGTTDYTVQPFGGN